VPDTPTRRLATVALVVRDYDEAIAYYTETFGFTLTADVDQGGGKRWVTVSPGEGAQILLAKAVGDEQTSRIGNQTGGRVGFFLQTSDFAADHARLTANGVKTVRGPVDQPYGRVAVIEDLYGNWWDLIGPAPDQAKR